jgi:S1-C subfamily serine protease
MSRKYQNRLKSLAVAVVLVMVGFMLGTTAYGTTSAQDAGPDLSLLTDSERTLAEIYDEASHSVVLIVVTVSLDSLAVPETFDPDDPDPDFTPPDEFGEGARSGSGFVIDLDGRIVTNAHVVEDANTIEVYFLDGTITRAELVGLDLDADIAVIQVDLPEDRLFPIAFGRVEELVVGQTVVAIGSPFGQRWTMTSGIVSALDRTINGLGNYSIGAVIQTDASINPGNSGGPLLNLRGQVVGVNAQISSSTRSNAGVGYAIPSDLVQRVTKELITTGTVSYSVMGIRGGDVDLAVMEALGLANNQRGVVVSTVIPGSPAEEAGLRDLTTAVVDEEEVLESADIITAVNGEPIISIGDLIAYLGRYTRPGDVIDLTVLRDGEQVIIPLTLGARNALDLD